MRIAYLAAGAGNTYCGACAHDAVLVRALCRAGHDVHMIPLYTPLKSPDDGGGDLPLDPIFFGGLNVFLQQSSALFRHLPKFFDRVLDRPAFLRWVSKFSIEVEPRKLGPMTVSVLAGKNGRQKKEVDRLLDHLAKEPRPNIIHLTNSLLSSLAPEIKRRIGVPVVCNFQGEDQFVRDLAAPHSARALDLIRTNAQSIDLFICPNEIMLPAIAEFLAVPSDRLRVVRTAVEILPPRQEAPQTFTIGYLSAIRPAKGLDILVDAIRILSQNDREPPIPLRLLIAGRIADPQYWQSIQKKLDQSRIKNGGGQKLKIPLVEYLGELTPPAKADFFHRCTLLALPSRNPEPRGVVALEAMAAALPVILPDSGVFPEILEHGGGILVNTLDPAHWADTLATLAANPARLQQLSAQARANMTTRHSPTEMAARTMELYEAFVQRTHQQQCQQ